MNGPALAKEFARRWKARHGQGAPVPFARAAKFFKELLADGVPAATLSAQMDFFFNRFSDPFVQRCGHSFGSFYSSYSALVVAWQDEKQKRQAASVTDENFEKLEKARKSQAGEKA